MKNLTLENIAKVCSGIYFGSESLKDKTISGVVIDSRKVEKDFLFVAVKGAKVDGHKFIPDVMEKGAAAVLSEQKLENPVGPYILVENTLEALKLLAEFYRKSLDIKVVGITGSVGKTSTKEMVASVLGEKYNVLKTEGKQEYAEFLKRRAEKIRHILSVSENGNPSLKEELSILDSFSAQ